MAETIIIPPLYAYLFFVHGDRFYIMEFVDDEAAIRDAKANDVLRVEDWHGNIIWRPTIQ